MSDVQNRQLLRLTALLQTVRRARDAADLEELGFVATNETHGIVPYRQAVLARPQPGRRGSHRVVAISGIAAVDGNAPYVQWLTRVFGALAARTGPAAEDGLKPVALGSGDLPDDLASEWARWCPPHAAVLPLGVAPGGKVAAPWALLLLVRETPFQEGELQLLAHLGEAYGHAGTLLRLGPGRLFRGAGQGHGGARRWLIGGAAAVALLVLLPVRQSALAPAEVVPVAPTLVRAPYDGVVRNVAVRPNQQVAAGDVLFTLDPARLDSQLEIARRSAAVAETEYRSAAQRALIDPEAKARLAPLQGELEQRQAEVAYLGSLAERLVVTAPQAGVVVFDDVNDWLGRPVTIGERVMLLADPAALKLEIRLPVGDAIPLEPGTEVKFYRNLAPDRPLPAILERIGYQAAEAPGGIFAYRLSATFAAQADLGEARLGLKGTARLYGERVALGRYLLRRPLAVVRQWLGV